MAHWYHMTTYICANIGSCNGLLPDGTKPLLEPMWFHGIWCRLILPRSIGITPFSLSILRIARLPVEQPCKFMKTDHTNALGTIDITATHISTNPWLYFMRFTVAGQGIWRQMTPAMFVHNSAHVFWFLAPFTIFPLFVVDVVARISSTCCWRCCYHCYWRQVDLPYMLTRNMHNNIFRGGKHRILQTRQG